MYKVIPLFSGSSGNSTFVKFNDTEILIDAGVSCKMLGQALNRIGTGYENIKAILVTHEHSDHIKGLEVIAKKYNIPIYINYKSFQALESERMKGFIEPKIKPIEYGQSTDLADISFSTFKTPHDSASSMGYRFEFSDGSTLGFATDMGYITKGIAGALFGCETVVIESNHDVEMLNKGVYPYYLKQRILSDIGHLSNKACAEFLPHLYKNGTKKIILAHLSEQNNTPICAYKTSAGSLENAGITSEELKLTVAMKTIL